MFQFTCPSRSTTDALPASASWLEVSIHVPLAEHDSNAGWLMFSQSSFNSRAPRGARPQGTRRDPLSLLFQFTCPSRSTTKARTAFTTPQRVSIHVPLAEHDKPFYIEAREDIKFQFTCPSRSTTCPTRAALVPRGFQFTCPSRSTTVFLSRYRLSRTFQFTCPSRSTTSERVELNKQIRVSIHVPLAEHDSFKNLRATAAQSFNSRAPRGARRSVRLRDVGLTEFQFTCPSRSTTSLGVSIPFEFMFQFTCPSRSTTHSL